MGKLGYYTRKLVTDTGRRSASSPRDFCLKVLRQKSFVCGGIYTHTQPRKMKNALYYDMFQIDISRQLSWPGTPLR
jgi:hypothetical protein